MRICVVVNEWSGLDGETSEAVAERTERFYFTANPVNFKLRKRLHWTA